MSPATQFTDAAAAEAWDTWFRWRDSKGLRDRTIDATWSRVANAIASVEGAKADLWAFRFVDAFSHWRLLPEERLLREAGTGDYVDQRQSPAAVLNLAAFVIAPLSSSARLDGERIADTAALAVRMLDDAQHVGGKNGAGPGELRLGVIGLADALHALNLAYDSEPARQQAREAAICIAEGALRGSIELACERGGNDIGKEALLGQLRDRGTAEPLILDAARWGVRHTRLTSVESHPRLALLANNVSDALDPLNRAPGVNGSRATTAGQQAFAALTPSLAAQLMLRAAVQPWIDAPIDYPLSFVSEPRLEELAALRKLASEHGLPPPSFRQGKLSPRMSADLYGGS